MPTCGIDLENEQKPKRAYTLSLSLYALSIKALKFSLGFDVG